MSSLRARSPRRPLVPGLLLVLPWLLLARPAPGADLGPHGGLSPGDAQGCRACHLGYPADKGIGPKARFTVPPGGQLRLGEAVARFCWLCHRAGNPYGAEALESGALAGTSHGSFSGTNAAPDSWAVGAAMREMPRQGDLLPANADLTCTTCHDPHEHGALLFLRNTTRAGDYSLLCEQCHPGRENRGLVGRENIIVRSEQPYSTHPTEVPVSDLPGNGGSGFLAKLPGRGSMVTCGLCHEVHPPRRAVADPPPGLLRLPAEGRVTDLCRSCHLPPAAGDPAIHPMEGGGSRGAYPVSFASSEGIPAAWKAPAHFNAGAATFSPGRGQPPRCTSCHDLHGGLPMTSLLYAPNQVQGGSGDWCFSCHPAAAVLPPGHEQRAPGAAGQACADCHGSAGADGARTWRAHRDFRMAPSPGSAPAHQSSTAPAAGGPAERQRLAVVTQLARALRDDRPFARENAAQALVRLSSPLALDGAIEALADRRPDVREKGARILGTINDERAVARLLGQLAAPVPEIRRSVVEALGRIGGEKAILPLIPLLRDPALEVRRAAVAAFAGVRDPRVYPALIEVLWDSDSELRRQAQDQLAQLNDARLLARLLEGENRGRITVPVLVTMINFLNDPAGAPQLIEALRIDHRLVRIAAATALRNYPDPAVVEALLPALENPDRRVRMSIVESLGALGAARAAGALLAILTDQQEAPGLRVAAITALTQIAASEVVPAFVEALGDREAEVRSAASRGLVHLTCQNFGQEQALWREWWGRQSWSFPLGKCR